MTIKINKFTAKCMLCCGIATALTGCRFEDEDYFDEPAALRIETTTNDIQQTLVNAQGGWVMQYFTGTDEIEGFNLFARFDNNQKVTLAGNHRFLRDGRANQYTEFASIYQMLKEDGPVLALNTWNDVLTPFVDPVKPSKAPNTLEKDGEGMKGDNNFVVLSYSPNEVLLRGERHSARTRLIPCNTTWQEYIDATANLKSKITNNVISSYYVASPTDTLYFKNLRSGVITYCERIDDPLFPTTINCVFTPQGFRLHHQNSIGSDANAVKFQEFTIAADSTSLVSENDSVRIIPCWDNYIIDRTVIWNINPNSFNSEQKRLFDEIDAQFRAYNANTSIDSIGIGRSIGSGAVLGLAITFYTNAAKTKTGVVGLEMNMAKTGFGQMSISCDDNCAVDRNMASVTNRGASELETLARAFAATISGTFNLTPDNCFLPTSATFNSVDGGKSFVLEKSK